MTIKTIDDLIFYLTDQEEIKLYNILLDQAEVYKDAAAKVRELKSHLDKYKWHKVEDELPNGEG